MRKPRRRVKPVEAINLLARQRRKAEREQQTAAAYVNRLDWYIATAGAVCAVLVFNLVR